MLMNTSSIGKMEDALMSVETRILKDNQLLYTKDTMEPIRDRRSSTLIKLIRKPQKESTKNLDGTSIDHSSLSQECHSTELLKHMETTMSTSEDMSRTKTNKCGSSMALIRQSETITGRTMPWLSNPMEEDNTSRSQAESTQDGGNYGKMNLHSL